MKRFIFILGGLLLFPLLVIGQKMGVGVGVGAGTLGFGGEVLVAPSSKIVLRGGISALPLKLDFTSPVKFSAFTHEISGNINWKSDKTMLKGHLIADFRFSEQSYFFVSAGLLFGKTEMDFVGVLDDGGQIPEDRYPVVVPFEKEYLLKFERDKTANINVGWNQKIMPYLGIGLGAPFPKNRIGFKLELGVAYQGDYEANSPQLVRGDLKDLAKNWDDFGRYEKWLNFYPVARLQLTVKLF